MKAMFLRHRSTGLLSALAICCVVGVVLPLAAGPINPAVFKDQFEAAAKNAEFVAKVRVVAVTCTATTGEGKSKSADLQLSLQILESQKGPAKKNDVVVVSHKVILPAGPGPGTYGYMAEVRKFPITPGVHGSVALRWDKDARCYTVIAGWVPEANNAAIPTEVGKTYVAGDPVKK
ncbi:MAG TPA: hypothetical protein VE988_17540 [Gemmataceae bacterium]|nr:hypothetical protein [Gemmataceae bacterium]